MKLMWVPILTPAWDGKRWTQIVIWQPVWVRS